MVLDQCLASGPLETVGARYDAVWRPEADAVSWIGAQIRYQSPVMMFRAILGRALGVNITSEAKGSTRSYADVRQAARCIRPLWSCFRADQHAPCPQFGGSWSASWTVVTRDVATEQIASVVAAVGRAHDGVHLERLGLVVVQENSLVAVVLNEDDGAVDPVVEGIIAAGAADPGDVRVVQVSLDLSSRMTARRTAARPGWWFPSSSTTRWSA